MVCNIDVTGKGDLVVGTYKLYNSSEGIFLSTDHGEHWQEINGDLPSKYITALTCTEDNIIFAGIKGPSQINLYKSIDYGVTWLPIGDLGTAYRYPTQLAYYDNLLLCYTDWPDPIQYSTDDGLTWTTTKISAGASTVRSSFAYRKSTGQLYFSIRNNALDDGDFYFIYASPDTFRTVTNISWSKGEDYSHAIVLDSDGNLFGASSGSGVMKSTDDGKTWIKKNSMENPFINTLAFDRNDNIYAGTTSGVIKSTDGGNTWIELTRGLNTPAISTLLTDDNGNLFVQGTREVFRYKMNGTRWEALNNGKRHPEISTLTTTGNLVFSCHDHRNGRWESYKLGYKLDDFSGRWVGINTYFTSVDRHPNGNLFGIFYEYLMSYGFYNSTDNGITWKGLSPPPYRKIVQIDSKGNIYTAGTGLSVSYNNAASFAPLNYSGEIYDLKIDKNDYMYIQPNKNSREIFRCKKIGDDWQNITTKLPAAQVNKLSTDKFGNLFVVINSGRIFYSETSGDSWSEITANLNSADLIDISITKDSVLYAGSSSGEVYFRYFRVKDTSDLPEIPDTSDPVSMQYNLSQNFPNPFNSGTKIIYSVPGSTNIKMKLYDVLGNELAVLLDAFREKGEYELQFNPAGLASGVYLYTLEAGEFKARRKLMLIK